MVPISPLEHSPLEVNKKIDITGLVQGVGFRPFIYQLADRYELKGYVQNSNEGVHMEVEGSSRKLDTFMQALFKELPPLARIDSIEDSEGQYSAYQDFSILHSQNDNEKEALILPDMALCDKCEAEMNTPSNRRYHYPFINCTDCGPRYSIINTIPYDRPNTSMHFFKMCKACEQEYNNPLDRRFHAQPISCFSCGPTLSLLDNENKRFASNEEAIQMAAKAVVEGKILALKGLGGFHLICDASNSETVSGLRKRKNRPAKPFAVMFSDIEEVKQFADISVEEEALILSKERPIVITSKRKDSRLCEEVSPGIDRIGVFLAYTPLHKLLLHALGRPVIATSANLSNEPIIRDAKVLKEKLGHVIDLILDHDRNIINTSDDSVVQMIQDKKVFLRMARGFTPKSIQLPFKSEKKILAVGANQKNTISLVFGDKLILSPYIADLNSIEAFEYFERTVDTFKRIYDFEAEVIVCDKHPEYESHKWAHQMKGKNPFMSVLEVQHHYAHILAVKAEHSLKEKVLGFAFDGTGYGGDGSIWGAEVMLADEHGFERLFSLRPFRLLGGDKAVKEPRRSALSLLFEYLSLQEVLELELAQEFSKDEIVLLHKGWVKALNAPYTSSMGRLFDAVASLSGICHISSYEGESGLKMEAYMDESITDSFDFEIIEGVINLEKMITEIIKMEDTGKIISMFFNTLVEIIIELSERYTELPIVFAGGVFQNRILLNKLLTRFKGMQRPIYFQNETAINDEGISLGQAWFALHNS